MIIITTLITKHSFINQPHLFQANFSPLIIPTVDQPHLSTSLATVKNLKTSCHRWRRCNCCYHCIGGIVVIVAVVVVILITQRDIATSSHLLDGSNHLWVPGDLVLVM